MESTFETKQERAVLVGLNADCFTKAQTATDETLEELEALLETAGGFCTGKILQNRHTPDAHSFIGEGKAQEVRMLVEFTESTMVIFDNELSPGNIRALEELLGVTVLDRSALILDIFAQRAKTREGRLQVELAQYKYLLPRLSGMGTSLSRQGGGIGTRGPGETKLESDRRHIRERISRLQTEQGVIRAHEPSYAGSHFAGCLAAYRGELLQRFRLHAQHLLFDAFSIADYAAQKHLAGAGHRNNAVAHFSARQALCHAERLSAQREAAHNLLRVHQPLRSFVNRSFSCQKYTTPE